MDVIFFETQPYYPKVAIQGKKTIAQEESQLLEIGEMETIKINSAPTTEPAAPPTNNPVAPTALAEIQMAEPSEPDSDSPGAQEIKKPHVYSKRQKNSEGVRI